MVFQRSGAHSMVVCDSTFRTEPDPDDAQPVAAVGLAEGGRLRRGRARVVGRVWLGGRSATAVSH